MTDFTSLAEASKAISEITKNSKVMHSNFMSSNNGDIIKQVALYLQELFMPLFDTNIRFRRNYRAMTIHKEVGYVVLYVGGWVKTLEIIITMHEVKFNIQPSPEMILSVAEAWSVFKFNIIKAIETEIKKDNERKQQAVDEMLQEQNIIMNFQV